MAAVQPRRRAGLLAIVLVLLVPACQVTATPGPIARPAAAPSEPDAPENAAPDPEPTGAQAAPQAPANRSVTLAFAGDVHFEGAVAAVAEQPDATLGPLSAALLGADVAMVNLESALTTGGSPAAKELEDPARRYWFRSPPAALGVLERSGVDVASMANNHGADFGAAGLTDTLRIARSSPVALVGVGSNVDEAFRPYEKTANGVGIAVLAVDASTLESRDPIWDVSQGRGPGLARDQTRLLAAVRAAGVRNEVVAVYLHWGTEGQSCPNTGQQRLARRLAAAGADVVVGSHTHRLGGAGLLGDTYVSYGLGNFLWYNGYQSDTGVLRLEIVDGKVVRDVWVPGQIGRAGGRPLALGGAVARDKIQGWRDLRACTDLAPGPGDQEAAARPSPEPSAALPAYASTIESLPAALRRRMPGNGHDPAACPVSLTDLRLLTVRHIGFDGRARTGQLVVHRQHAEGLAGVFRELYEARFPVRRMQTIDAYGGDDDRSMAADNSSAYNCRAVAGSSNLSDHAYGAAVDLNPVENPYVTANGVLPPAGRRFVEVDRSPGAEAGRGVIVADDFVVRAFARIGWQWGGTWNEADYQHFYAP